MKKGNPNKYNLREWRKKNPEKDEANRIRTAFRFLVKHGIIDGEKVLTDPTK